MQYITVPLAKLKFGNGTNTQYLWQHWSLCQWAEATFLKDVSPEGMKSNQQRSKPSRQYLNNDFFILTLYISQGKSVQDLLLCKVRAKITLRHPPIPSCPYLPSNSLLTLLINVSDSADGDECFSLSDSDTMAETVRQTHIRWPTAWLRQVKENKVQSILKVGK